MIAQRLFKGDVITYTNSGETDISYMDVVSLTTRIAIAVDDIPAGENGPVETVGVFQLPAETTAAFAVGDKLYWDETNKILTKTATDMIPAGWCTAAKAQASASTSVKLEI